MTDPTEPINEARVRLKKLAASMLVRKERLEGELKLLEAEQARVAQELDLITSASAGEPEPEIAAIRDELAAKVGAKRDELAQAEADLNGALRQFDDLAKVKTQAERDALRAVVAGATSRDPFSRDPADVALANVREHIGELDARVRLNDELADVERAAPAPARVVEDPDAKARAILAELKAKKRGALPSGDVNDAGDAGDPPDGPAPAPKKKRTL